MTISTITSPRIQSMAAIRPDDIAARAGAFVAICAVVTAAVAMGRPLFSHGLKLFGLLLFLCGSSDLNTSWSDELCDYDRYSSRPRIFEIRRTYGVQQNLA